MKTLFFDFLELSPSNKAQIKIFVAECNQVINQWFTPETDKDTLKELINQANEMLKK